MKLLSHGTAGPVDLAFPNDRRSLIHPPSKGNLSGVWPLEQALVENACDFGLPQRTRPQASTYYHRSCIDFIGARILQIAYQRPGELWVGTKVFRRGPHFLQNLTPPSETFRDAAAYVATQSHEATHWTAPPHRVNRELSYAKDRSERAREELIAELGS